jgi:hypothetical protein
LSNVHTLELPDTSDLRKAGGLMLAAAAVLPALPAHPPLLCPLKTITGVPCPLCGMTTSVEATVHLNFGAAMAATPAGVLLVVAAIVLLFRRPTALRVPLSAVFAVLALMWAFQLQRFGFL